MGITITEILEYRDLEMERITVLNKQQIHNFALKWIAKFQDENINYLELVDCSFSDECFALGFEMDCGNAFRERYGQAVNDCDALEKIVDDIIDINLLGSAIFSQWRYFNHWADNASEILEYENRRWFELALSRLEFLSNLGF